MICANVVLPLDAAVLRGRIHTHQDMRPAPDGPNLPDQHHWANDLTTFLESRAEIGDLHASALCVVEPRHEYRRVSEIMLLSSNRANQLDAERPGLIGPRLAVEQRADRRIAVEAWEAAPHDARIRVDHCADAAVANEREIQ